MVDNGRDEDPRSEEDGDTPIIGPQLVMPLSPPGRETPASRPSTKDAGNDSPLLGPTTPLPQPLEEVLEAFNDICIKWLDRPVEEQHEQRSATPQVEGLVATSFTGHFEFEKAIAELERELVAGVRRPSEENQEPIANGDSNDVGVVHLTPRASRGKRGRSKPGKPQSKGPEAQQKDADKDSSPTPEQDADDPSCSAAEEFASEDEASRKRLAHRVDKYIVIAPQAEVKVSPSLQSDTVSVSPQGAVVYVDAICQAPPGVWARVVSGLKVLDVKGWCLVGLHSGKDTRLKAVSREEEEMDAADDDRDEPIELNDLILSAAPRRGRQRPRRRKPTELQEFIQQHQLTPEASLQLLDLPVRTRKRVLLQFSEAARELQTAGPGKQADAPECDSGGRVATVITSSEAVAAPSASDVVLSLITAAAAEKNKERHEVEAVQVFIKRHALNTVVASALSELPPASRRAVVEEIDCEHFEAWENKNAVIMHRIRVASGEEVDPAAHREPDENVDARAPANGTAPGETVLRKRLVHLNPPVAPGSRRTPAALTTSLRRAVAAVSSRMAALLQHGDREGLRQICRGSVLSLARDLQNEGHDDEVTGTVRALKAGLKVTQGVSARKKEEESLLSDLLVRRLQMVCLQLLAAQATDADLRAEMHPVLKEWGKRCRKKQANRTTNSNTHKRTCPHCDCRVMPELAADHEEYCSSAGAARARILEVRRQRHAAAEALLHKLEKKVSASRFFGPSVYPPPLSTLTRGVPAKLLTHGAPVEQVLSRSVFDGLWDTHFSNGTRMSGSWSICRPVVAFRHSDVGHAYRIREICWTRAPPLDTLLNPDSPPHTLDADRQCLVPGLVFRFDVLQPPDGWSHEYSIALLPHPTDPDTLCGRQWEAEMREERYFRLVRSEKRRAWHSTAKRTLEKDPVGHVGLQCIGSFVHQVTPLSPAAEAGITEGCRILSVGDRPVTNDDDIAEIIAGLPWSFSIEFHRSIEGGSTAGPGKQADTPESPPRVGDEAGPAFDDGEVGMRRTPPPPPSSLSARRKRGATAARGPAAKADDERDDGPPAAPPAAAEPTAGASPGGSSVGGDQAESVRSGSPSTVDEREARRRRVAPRKAGPRPKRAPVRPRPGKAAKSGRPGPEEPSPDRSGGEAAARAKRGSEGSEHEQSPEAQQQQLVVSARADRAAARRRQKMVERDVSPDESSSESSAGNEDDDASSAVSGISLSMCLVVQPSISPPTPGSAPAPPSAATLERIDVTTDALCSVLTDDCAWSLEGTARVVSNLAKVVSTTVNKSLPLPPSVAAAQGLWCAFALPPSAGDAPGTLDQYPFDLSSPPAATSTLAPPISRLNAAQSTRKAPGDTILPHALLYIEGRTVSLLEEKSGELERVGLLEIDADGDIALMGVPIKPASSCCLVYGAAQVWWLKRGVLWADGGLPDATMPPQTRFLVGRPVSVMEYTTPTAAVVEQEGADMTRPVPVDPKTPLSSPARVLTPREFAAGSGNLTRRHTVPAAMLRAAVAGVFAGQGVLDRKTRAYGVVQNVVPALQRAGGPAEKGLRRALFECAAAAPDEEAGRPADEQPPRFTVEFSHEENAEWRETSKRLLVRGREAIIPLSSAPYCMLPALLTEVSFISPVDAGDHPFCRWCGCITSEPSGLCFKCAYIQSLKDCTYRDLQVACKAIGARAQGSTVHLHRTLLKAKLTRVRAYIAAVSIVASAVAASVSLLVPPVYSLTRVAAGPVAKVALVKIRRALAAAGHPTDQAALSFLRETDAARPVFVRSLVEKIVRLRGERAAAAEAELKLEVKLEKVDPPKDVPPKDEKKEAAVRVKKEAADNDDDSAGEDEGSFAISSDDENDDFDLLPGVWSYGTQRYVIKAHTDEKTRKLHFSQPAIGFSGFLHEATSTGRRKLIPLNGFPRSSSWCLLLDEGERLWLTLVNRNCVKSAYVDSAGSVFLEFAERVSARPARLTEGDIRAAFDTNADEDEDEAAAQHPTTDHHHRPPAATPGSTKRKRLNRDASASSAHEGEPAGKRRQKARSDPKGRRGSPPLPAPVDAVKLEPQEASTPSPPPATEVTTEVKVKREAPDADIPTVVVQAAGDAPECAPRVSGSRARASHLSPGRGSPAIAVVGAAAAVRSFSPDASMTDASKSWSPEPKPASPKTAAPAKPPSRSPLAGLAPPDAAEPPSGAEARRPPVAMPSVLKPLPSAERDDSTPEAPADGGRGPGPNEPENAPCAPAPGGDDAKGEAAAGKPGKPASSPAEPAPPPPPPAAPRAAPPPPLPVRIVKTKLLEPELLAAPPPSAPPPPPPAVRIVKTKYASPAPLPGSGAGTPYPTNAESPGAGARGRSKPDVAMKPTSPPLLPSEAVRDLAAKRDARSASPVPPLEKLDAGRSGHRGFPAATDPPSMPRNTPPPGKDAEASRPASPAPPSAEPAPEPAAPAADAKKDEPARIPAVEQQARDPSSGRSPGDAPGLKGPPKHGADAARSVEARSCNPPGADAAADQKPAAGGNSAEPAPRDSPVPRQAGSPSSQKRERAASDPDEAPPAEPSPTPPPEAAAKEPEPGDFGKAEDPTADGSSRQASLKRKHDTAAEPGGSFSPLPPPPPPAAGAPPVQKQARKARGKLTALPPLSERYQKHSVELAWPAADPPVFEKHPLSTGVPADYGLWMDTMQYSRVDAAFVGELTPEVRSALREVTDVGISQFLPQRNVQFIEWITAALHCWGIPHGHAAQEAPIPWVLRGEAYLRLQQPRCAIFDFNQALSLDFSPSSSTRARAYKFRAYAYRRIGFWKEALRDLRQSHLLEPLSRDWAYVYRLIKQFGFRQGATDLGSGPEDEDIDPPSGRTGDVIHRDANRRMKSIRGDNRRYAPY
ncbi:hypothetical protein DIPPA_29597 [Diplonema papillatum]|nr:hypothetical protein DIPPA_29597 [Diplonema papillatum]